MTQQQSTLVQDLNAQSRDVLYCAEQYITRQGGPKIAGSPADIENLRHASKASLEWLERQPNRDSIEQGYGTFKLHWSPVYPD